jgi:hypothetical protein
MTKKIYYEKVGRKYVPVAEYDSDWIDRFPKGSHLVMCYPGGNSRVFNIDPDYASLIAASRVARDAMCKAIVKASELRPSKSPITPKQKEAWDNLAKAFGQEMYTLQGSSAWDIAEAGIKALQEEAKMLESNEAVKKAMDHLNLIVELTKEQK